MNKLTINRSFKFIRSILICTVLGGLVGFCMSYFHPENSELYQVSQLNDFLPIILIFVILIQIAIFIYCSNCRHRIKKDNYNDDELSIYDQIGGSMEFVNGIGTTLAVTFLPISFLAPIISSSLNQLWLTLLLIVFNTGLNSINEIQMLQTIGKIDPKKNVDWSKMNFNQDYYYSLDECEKEKVGIIGSKLITKIHIIFAILFILCSLLSRFVEFSGMEFIIMGFLWGFFTFFIALEGRKQDMLKK